MSAATYELSGKKVFVVFYKRMQTNGDLKILKMQIFNYRLRKIKEITLEMLNKKILKI